MDIAAASATASGSALNAQACSTPSAASSAASSNIRACLGPSGRVAMTWPRGASSREGFAAEGRVDALDRSADMATKARSAPCNASGAGGDGKGKLTTCTLGLTLLLPCLAGCL
jgi:hypothetical protein